VAAQVSNAAASIPAGDYAALLGDWQSPDSGMIYTLVDEEGALKLAICKNPYAFALERAPDGRVILRAGIVGEFELDLNVANTPYRISVKFGGRSELCQRVSQDAADLATFVGAVAGQYYCADAGTTATIVAVGDGMIMRMADGHGGVEVDLTWLGGRVAFAKPKSSYALFWCGLDFIGRDGIMTADMESHGGVGTVTTGGSSSENLSVALLEVQMHDRESAALRLKTTLVDEKNASDVAEAAIPRALLAEEGGDFGAAAKVWDTFAAAYADPTFATANPQYICFAAVTYEKTGQPAKADAALKPFGNGTLVDCYRFKGDVLDLRGDWSGAQEWYAKAVKLAPSIPSGYYSWGVALAKHGDLDGAAAKFGDANQKGPHWADPLKAWGDVLVKQGNTKDALAKYDEALKYAPNWKQLKESRDAAAKVTR
jgi:hypothetical protein